MSESELSQRIEEHEKRLFDIETSVVALELSFHGLLKEFRELRHAMRAFACEEKE